MSFLAPLFAIGLIGLAIPILVHLVHKERKETTPFPSLMFLLRTPYQHSRRQRIRDWLLFLTRALVFLLLVAAFTRPVFNRPPDAVAAATGGGREVVILLDRSFSMRVGDRWSRAQAAARQAMDGLGPADRATLVLFADQAGDVFEILTQDCDLHTVLRLPNGTFAPYAAGVKTNVIFFTKGEPTNATWIYDARTNVPGFTKKDRPMTREFFADFERCYGADPNGRAERRAEEGPEDRWRKFTIGEIKERDFKIDSLKWLKDESLDDAETLPEPEELAADAIAELENAVEELNAILTLLEKEMVEG